MPVSRRWLLAGALGVAAVTCWAGRLAPGWLPPPGSAAGDGADAESAPRRSRSQRRRRVASDTGRGRQVVLFGLPAAGRTALMVRALLARPSVVTVPRPVTDRPDSGRSGTSDLLQHVSASQLSTEHTAGRLMDVHRRGDHRYGTPLDWGAVVPGQPPLRLVKATLDELPRLLRLCDEADANEDQPSVGHPTPTADGADGPTGGDTDGNAEPSADGTTDVPDSPLASSPEVPTAISSSAKTSTTDTSISRPVSTEAADLDAATSTAVRPVGSAEVVRHSTSTVDVTHPPSASTRPLLVLVDVSNRSELATRLARRDQLCPAVARRRVRAAEQQLTAALSGRPLRSCFDAVIANDSLDWAAARLVRLVDEQLDGADPESRGATAVKMYSAQQMCPSDDADAEAVTEEDESDDKG